MRLIASKKKKIIFGVVLLVVLLLIGALAFGLFGEKDKNNDDKEVHYSQLTGEEVEAEVAQRPILGVMLENSDEARPQTGLDSAGIVFEGVTEGGITRYLALYQEDMPEIVGPVRSLRTHFLDWVLGFDASVAHVGGSAEALELAEQRKAKSLSQFNHPDPYYRDDKRESPHNMYARVEDLRELQKELSHDRSEFEEIPRKAETTAGDSQEPQTSQQSTQQKQAQSVTVDFSAPLYKAEFRYDQATNSYTRYLAGEPHVDTITNQPIKVKNVIVIKTDRQETGVDATGAGEALIFMDGNVQEVRWQKSSYQNRLKLIDSNNNQVPLNRGDSWFAVVAKDRAVTY